MPLKIRSGEDTENVKARIFELAVHYSQVRMDLMYRKWLSDLEVNILFIEPGSLWENGYIESFNGKMRDQFLNREIFYSLREAKILIERWRHHYNNVRAHSSLGGEPPVPETKCYLC